MAATKSKEAEARVTRQGWILKNGEYANISAPKTVNCDGIVSLFRKMASRSEKRNGLPKALRDTAEIAFSQGNSRLFIRINVRSQDTRSEKFVGAVTKEILRICRT